jgi:cation transport ATPase
MSERKKENGRKYDRHHEKRQKVEKDEKEREKIERIGTEERQDREKSARDKNEKGMDKHSEKAAKHTTREKNNRIVSSCFFLCTEFLGSSVILLLHALPFSWNFLDELFLSLQQEHFLLN